ncbi:conserved hypothetical protein [Candidatus Sulfopaludibacter sp. SbA4]|nr:conserved hypothetical protein [Candidatus Sulfopaludibacter sp. SbA4]
MIGDHSNSSHPTTSELVKVNLPLPPEDQAQGVEAENLWAEPLGEDLYRIDNVPFYAYGISHEDVVVADEADGRLRFRAIAARGGHSTYRVLVKDSAGFESAGFQKLWARLSELGCTHEVAKRRWISIDVPSDSDIFVVYRILEEGMAQGVWTFEEAHCGHPSVRSGEPK